MSDKFNIIEYCVEEEKSLMQAINDKFPLPDHMKKLTLTIGGIDYVLYSHGYNILDNDKFVNITLISTALASEAIDNIGSCLTIRAKDISFDIEGIHSVNKRFTQEEGEDLLMVSFSFDDYITL